MAVDYNEVDRLQVSLIVEQKRRELAAAEQWLESLGGPLEPPKEKPKAAKVDPSPGRKPTVRRAPAKRTARKKS